jgi:glutamate-1-semialdehyde 2,1-aminomutase
MSDLNQQLFERALKVSPGGVHSPVRGFKNIGRSPIFFKSAQGPYLYSVEDKRYLDFCMSFGPLILGHRDPEIAEVVNKMVNTAWSFGAAEPYSLELAEWITSHIPWVQKVRFVSSGTEAVMSALRVARAATGRDKVLKFDGCYHGHFDSLLVKAGSGLAGVSSSSSAGVSEQTAQDTLVCPLDNEQKLAEIFSNFGKQIAVVVIEPLPANYGLLPQRKEFIDQVVALAKSHGCLLLLDEVISGFRVALGGMAEILGITPDLVCYGKIVGGGFPVGCYGGRADLMNLVAPQGAVYQAGTLSANPIGMSAGLATLKKLKRDQVWGKLEKRTQNFASALQAQWDKSAIPLQIVNYASLFWIHKKTDATIRAPELIPNDQGSIFAPFFRAALERGIYLAPNAYEVGFLSTAHEDSLLEESVFALKDAALAKQ